VVPKKDLVEHILNFLPKSMESLSNILLYWSKLPTLNDLTGILLHDEARRNLKGRRPRMKHSFSIPNLVKSKTNMRRTIIKDQSPNMKALQFLQKSKPLNTQLC